jgi:hypothetical protein
MRGEQEAAAFIRGIGSDQQATADEGELGIVDVVGTQEICVLWVEGAGKQDGTVGTFGQVRERDEEVVRMLVRGAGTTAALDGAEGIDYDEDSVVVFDGGFQVAEVVGETEGILAGRHSAGGPDGDGVEEQDVVRIGSCGLEAWLDGIAGIIMWRDEDDGALLAGSAIGEGGAAGDAGGEVQAEQGEAEACRAVHEGEFTKGEALGPEPFERFGSDVGEEEALRKGLKI